MFSNCVLAVVLSMSAPGHTTPHTRLLSEPERAQHYHVYGGKSTVVDGRRPTTSQARAMMSTRTSRMDGAPPLLAMNGKGYTVLNESSASGQSTRTSSIGGAPPLLSVNGQGYTVLHVHNESSASM